MQTKLDSYAVKEVDEDNGREHIYYFNDTVESITKRLLMDSEVEAFLPVDALDAFLLKTLDPNAMMVMRRMVLLWDNEEGQSRARDALETEYNDEYAQYIATDNLLGQTWVERQIIIINVSAVFDICRELYKADGNMPFTHFFAAALLQTIYHESRHLFYECNEKVPKGPGTKYPENGGEEYLVEEYGNEMAWEHLKAFLRLLSKEQIERLPL